MVQDFKVILNQPPQQSYFPGSEVSGIVSFQVTEAKRYSYVKISLLGGAHVAWSVTTGSGDHQTTHYYSANRDYINLQTVVWSHYNDGVLYPGPYSFPFQFMIPNQRLPPTFGKKPNLHNGIRYEVEGRIGTGVPKHDHVIHAEFPLSEVVDTNIPQLQEPARATVTKTVCCWCCASGPITLTAEIPRTGFCIGEVIPLNVHLENGSSRQIRLSVTFQQRVVYRAQGRHRYGSDQVLRLLSGPMQPRTPTLWSPGDELIIPLIEPTLTSCDIINIGYFLKVSAHIPGAIRSSVDIPIRIGNVPRQDPNQASVTGSFPLVNVPPVAGPAPYSPQQEPTAYGPEGATPYNPPGLNPQTGTTPTFPQGSTTSEPHFTLQGQPPAGPGVGWVESSTGPGQGQPVLLLDTSTKSSSEVAPPPYSEAIAKF